ncbi:MAG TPA: 3-oxoacyl-[acyl-carrier-protein] synthase III C-terminal domain-containing protein [Actinophytocola sp.]|uniref:3-oxoacyl-ACP synthase III family protein n=1 Tax=Actinophytocola sp. TaxID=1872138 RepID=UPI002DB9D2C0|nr:3-oxoacyl-[acyl-carrier-protein] synthase III C-terminal domain-containing protein [Actinophytocola sp.]HEU5470985.1 3-oxoacyl-[acyl-carrier-protein] synthase III C-terminal domain-containing protein [Actinophytocola sp.]
MTEADSRAPYRSRIAGAGRHLPVTHLTTDELMASTRHRTHIDLERLTGIHERRVSVGDEDSYTLATSAALDCLRRSGRPADTLDVVINCSISKCRKGFIHWIEPTMSIAVAGEIGATKAMTFDLSNACAGMLSGVTVLNNMIRQGVVERGLVVSGEYISQLGRNAARHVRNILSRELASLTLGDAGAALLLERAPERAGGIRLAGFTTLAGHSRLCVGYTVAGEPEARMFTKARAIHKAATAAIPPLLQEVLDTVGIGLGEVDHVITHQTSARAIRKGMAHVTAVLGDAPRHEAVISVDRYGNTASTTHTVALIDELAAGRIQPGETIALIALASGLEIGVVLFTADEQLLEQSWAPSPRTQP